LAINIDISNYEEYLLSAVDGELNEEEQAALEVFLQLHPTYRQEFLLLQSARIVPDNELRFDGKEMLYRQSASNTLSAGNYEGFLLDYVDKELNTADQRKVEALAQQHPHISRELRLLEASRLMPDLSVRFPDKKRLYRNTNRVRGIWWWAAAAAVVAGVAVVMIPPRHTATQGTEMAVHQQQPVVTTPSYPSSPSAQQVVKEAEVLEKPAVANRQIASSRPVPTHVTPAVAVPQPAVPVTKREDNPASVALNKLPQPESTTSEIVQQLKEQKEQQQIANSGITNETDKAPVIAKSENNNKEDAMNTRVTDASRPVQGELVVSVTMRGDSKILNGVANVARFFSKKKK